MSVGVALPAVAAVFFTLLAWALFAWPDAIYGQNKWLPPTLSIVAVIAFTAIATDSAMRGL